MSLRLCARPLRTTSRALISQTFCQPSPDLRVTPPDFIPLVHHRNHAFTGTKRTFNPHNSTRPPQPPAASFKPAYRKCLVFTPRSADTFLPEAFPIKRSDFSSMCRRPTRSGGPHGRDTRLPGSGKLGIIIGVPVVRREIRRPRNPG